MKLMIPKPGWYRKPGTQRLAGTRADWSVLSNSDKIKIILGEKVRTSNAKESWWTI